MLKLPDVTLISVTGLNPWPALYAIWKSQKGIQFGESKVVTHEAFNPPDFVKNEITKSHKLDSIDSYNHFMIYELHRHINTEFALVVQADGYVINPNSWRKEFLDFDYIGAPWPVSRGAYLDPFGGHQRVGNGGFSLRSRKLMALPELVEIPFDVNANDFYMHMGAGLLSEDGNICVHNRHLFEAAGCRYAPLDLALTFSIERRLVERRFRSTFGFHKSIPKTHMLKDWIDRKQFSERFLVNKV